MGDPRRAPGLNEYRLTPFEKLNVNWTKTKAWSEGGYYARVFFNVQREEPQGVVPASRQGSSLVAGMDRKARASGGGSHVEAERIVHDRLGGWG